MIDTVAAAAEVAAQAPTWNLERFGLLGVLSMIIWAVIKGIWVPGSAFTAMKSERDAAMALATKSLDVAEKSTEVADRLTSGWKQP